MPPAQLLPPTRTLKAPFSLARQVIVEEPEAPSVAGTAETTVTAGAVVSLLTTTVPEPVLATPSVTQTRIVFAPSARSEACTVVVVSAPHVEVPPATWVPPPQQLPP